MFNHRRLEEEFTTSIRVEYCALTQSTRCAAGHDEPMRLEGLGLHSAARIGLTVTWASWGDFLGMIHDRLQRFGGTMERRTRKMFA